MLENTADWSTLQVGQAVHFSPADGKKGLEARAITLAKQKPSNTTSLENIPGRHGIVLIQRGTYTNTDKNMHNCDGLAFAGYRTFGGRFPRNDRMINLLRDMRAVFDRDNKFWFLPISKANTNITRINELIRISKKTQRNRIIKKLLTSGIIFLPLFYAGYILFSSVTIALLALLFLGGGGGSPFGPKISCTGNVWFAGKRYT